MRELILKMSVSIDGFVASPDGSAQWVFGRRDDQAVAWTVSTLWEAGLHLMGSRTFHDMAAYWPTSTEVFAPPMNQIPKAVFSAQGASILPTAVAPAHTLSRQPGADSWAQAHVVTGDLREEVARLKAGDGKPIIAHGGVRFARSLVASGVVDRYALLVHPVALGKGLSLFADLPEPIALRLLSSTAFPGGAVAQVYRPA